MPSIQSTFKITPMWSAVIVDLKTVKLIKDDLKCLYGSAGSANLVLSK